MGMGWRIGERVRVRTEDKDVKVWGRVVDVQTSTEAHEVTLGGSLDGPPPDRFRTFAPGKTSIRLIVELEI